MAHRGRSDAKLWFVYGIAHFGKSLMWAASGIVFAFFLTEMALIRPDVMGSIIGASLLAQAALDFIVGRSLRKHVQSHQRAAEAQLWGGILAAAGFALFSCAGLMPQNLAPAYAFATLLCFRLGCSCYDVPQNAFMAFVTHSDSSRARYSAMRYVMSGMAALFTTLIIAPVIRNVNRDSAAMDFVLFSLTVALISIVCSALLCVIARQHTLPGRAIEHDRGSAGQNTQTPDPLFKPVFVGALLAIIALNMSASVFSNLEAYFVAYAVRDAQAAAFFLASVAIGQIVAQPVWAWVAAKTSLERVFIAASILFLTAGLLFLGFGQMGGSVTLGIGAIYGAAYGGAAMSIWSVLAKSTAASPARTTQRYGLFTCCSKLAQMTAIVMVGIALASIDYRGGVDGQFQLRIVMGIAPVVGGLIALALIGSGLLKPKPPD